jgi:hypothetical protein
VLSQVAWAAAASVEAAPIRTTGVPDVGALLLESPRVQAAPSEADFGPGSSTCSSFEGEAGVVTPGRLGPSDFELLRVVGQGAFGKVISCFIIQTISASCKGLCFEHEMVVACRFSRSVKRTPDTYMP